MLCLKNCLAILVVGIWGTFGQDGQFEYECDILQRLDYVEKELRDARETINNLKENASPGSTFVRWGRTTCPGNGTDLVYSGIAAGSWYDHTGAAVNYMCLPEMPVYNKDYDDTASSSRALIYGAEYQLDNTKTFFPDIPEIPALDDNNVPCAVCRTTRSTVLMVPAQNTCMGGWTQEYRGLLVGGYYGHRAASEYICLDGQPEYIAGGGSNQNGKLLYYVEGRCGSLPCPPYVNGREITCAVCTK